MLHFNYLFILVNTHTQTKNNSFRHSWLRRRVPKPPSDAPPPNRPSAVLRHHQLFAVQQQPSISNGDISIAGGRTNSGNRTLYSTRHHQQQQSYNTKTNAKNVSFTNEFNRRQKLPHINGVQLNSIMD